MHTNMQICVYVYIQIYPHLPFLNKVPYSLPPCSLSLNNISWAYSIMINIYVFTFFFDSCMGIHCMDVSYIIIPNSLLVDILIIFRLFLLQVVLQLILLYIYLFQCIFTIDSLMWNCCVKGYKHMLFYQRLPSSFPLRLCNLTFPSRIYENACHITLQQNILSNFWIDAILINEKRCFILEQS